MKQLTVGSLFSGIGGIDLGLERAGMRTVWFSEIDPYASRVLAKHWPTIPNHGDITQIDFAAVEPVDVIAGGFPCQDLSNAGKRAGIDGERSGLWSEYVRAIRDLRPRYVLVENVAALLSGESGDWASRFFGDLAALGYDAEWDCIPASAVGAPHQRDRVFVVAYPERQRPAVGAQSGRGEGSVPDQHGKRPRDAAGWPLVQPRATSSGQDVADAHRAGSQGVWPQRSRAGWRGADGHTRPSGMGGRAGPEWWTTEPAVGRVANGVPAELDFLRWVIGHESNYQKAEPASQELVGRILRTVWEQRELATASPDLYRNRLRDLVPAMPRERARQGWLLGPGIEADAELCSLWRRVHAEPLKETQDLLPELLERIGQKKRPQALGSRTDRLRGLGNAVVPQVAELVGGWIIQHANSEQREAA